MKEVTTTEVEQMLAARQPVRLIDVRETEELQEVKIPGVIHIPLGLLEFKLQDLPKEDTYVLICRSGGRSGRAAQLLESRGYDVMNMTGGMLDWNGPTE
ncbi:MULTISPECIES: rhodanese-like domain-containing protein [Sporosarcina]|uniref:rhodanese-like domain-containing protein n=1 Tax=Sporosarcina TaxID=1569 RepID=UPI00058B511C|nr:MULTISPECIES: rhodanese-like domain-containing protein [Sporosarcina]WJY26258.1 rhodanese-like domain-containing protein [Sporosarcina sp. 0.2-SM1T-5]